MAVLADQFLWKASVNVGFQEATQALFDGAMSTPDCAGGDLRAVSASLDDTNGDGVAEDSESGVYRPRLPLMA